MKRVLIVAMAALVVAACSVSRLAYNNATPLLLWKIDDYVDLSADQRHWVRERLHEAFAWHRQAELPEYQRFVEWAIERSADTIDADEARAAWQRLREYYARTVEHILPPAADFLAQVNEEQVQQMERRFREDNQRYLKENRGSLAKRQERAAQRLVEQFEDWTGNLNHEQEEIIRTRVRGFPDTFEMRLEDRRRRQSEFTRLVRSKPSREQMAAGLRRILLQTETWRQPDYAAQLRERENAIFALIAELSPTLTPEQRRHLHRRMRGYAEDISTLARADSHRRAGPQAAATGGT